jgi:hypothetical protein
VFKDFLASNLRDLGDDEDDDMPNLRDLM